MSDKIKQAKKLLKQHLKELEKTRDKLRDLHDDIESACCYAEDACEELQRVIDNLSEIV